MTTKPSGRKVSRNKKPHPSSQKQQVIPSTKKTTASRKKQARKRSGSANNAKKGKRQGATKTMVFPKNQRIASKVGNKKRQSTRFRRSRGVLGQLLLSLFLTVGLIWLISVFTFTIHRVDSYMMTPALTDRDVVFVNKVKSIRRFDLVLLRNKDGSQSVRRVIGLPGDRLYYKNDQLYLNNEVQVERFLTTRLEEAHQSNQILTADVTLRQATGEEVVSKNGYFVLGDNRQYAEDSRTYGVVGKKEIVGVVQLKLLPLYDMRYLQ